MHVSANGTALSLVVACLLGLWSAPAVTRGEAPDKQVAIARTEDDGAEEYYELFGMLADAIAQVEANYVKPIERRALFEAAIRGVMRELDPHSNYIDEEDFDAFRQEVESEFGGLGIQISTDGDRLTVISPLVGTPAYQAGIQAGDQIVAIDGDSTEGLPLSRAVSRLKGPSGTAVKLSVARRGTEDPLELELTRARIHLDTVLGYSRNADHGWDFLATEDPDIAYVRVTAFSRDTASELRQVLGRLRADGMQGLVLDLRFNPGGLLTAAIEVADLFVSSGAIVSTAGRNIEQRQWQAQAAGTQSGFPMVVLVNRFSASASEVVAACLQDHERAVIVGQRTWGKGSVQNVVELEDGKGALKLTTSSYRRPSGENIHRFPDAKDDDQWGVHPNDGFEVSMGLREIQALMARQREQDILRPKATSDSAGNTETSTSEFTDRQLERALEYLRDQLAAQPSEP